MKVVFALTASNSSYRYTVAYFTDGVCALAEFNEKKEELFQPAVELSLVPNGWGMPGFTKWPQEDILISSSIDKLPIWLYGTPKEEWLDG